MTKYFSILLLIISLTLNAQTRLNVPSQYSSIQSAIDASKSGDTVLVQTGTYSERINYSGKNIVVASNFIITKDTSVISKTIIDGNNLPSVVSFKTKENQSAKLIGFTIQKGFYNGGDYRFNGGGVLIDGASPSVSNCIIKDNYISWYGGGICIKNGSSAILNSIKISNNHSEHHGGGIAIIESSPILTNIIINSNSTGERGGGIYLASLVQPTLINCTIFNNTAQGYSNHFGGGIALNNLDSKMLVLNSIIWNNTPNQIDNEFNQTIPVFYSNIQNGYNGIGNINSSPMFFNAATSNFRLLNSSPSIGKGIDSLYYMNSWYKAPEYDYANFSRPQPSKTKPDQGAFENFLAIPIPQVTNLLLPLNNSVNNKQPIVFRWNKSNYAEKYILVVGKDASFSNIAFSDSISIDTLKSISTFDNGVKYYWKVIAKNAGGSSSWSDVWNFTTIVALPTKPILTFPSSSATNQPKDITLKWNKVKDAEKYFIQLSNDQSFATIIKNDSTTADTLKTISSLYEGEKYYWRVQSKNVAGSSSWSDLGIFTTKITAPSNLILSRSGLKELTLKWNDNSNNESGYLIERKQLSTAGYSILDTLKNTNPLYVDKKVEQGFTYYYRIKAYTNLAQSDYSNEASIVVVGIEYDNTIPTEYTLSQNYPNPFNPTTEIKFGLPENTTVKLSVFNSLGQEVKILINGELNAGYHVYKFNASNLTSGIYYYRISTQNYSTVKKLMLLK